MSGRRSSSGFRAAAFGVLLAFCSAVHGLGFRFTARDGLLDTPENCDAACREAWRSYSSRGNVWFALAAVLFVVSVALGFWSHRTRGDIG
jgi:hypothetical protein